VFDGNEDDDKNQCSKFYSLVMRPYYEKEILKTKKKYRVVNYHKIKKVKKVLLR